jgi:hypothetical protein
MSNEALFAWFGRILTDLKEKSLKKALKMRFFCYFNEYIAETGLKEYVEIKRELF